MKNLKIELTEKDWKLIKNYLVNFPTDEKIRYSQNDYMIWLIHNLPKHPKKFTPNHDLLDWLENPKNTKSMSADKIQQLKLIGKGIVTPSQDEKILIDNLLRGN